MPDVEKLKHNISKSVELYQEALTKLSEKNLTSNVTLPTHFMTSYFDVWNSLVMKPDKLLQFQLEYYRDYMKLVSNISSKFLGENSGENSNAKHGTAPRDRRFHDKVWHENAVYAFIKQSYHMTSDWLVNLVNSAEGIDKKTLKQAKFYTKQLTDAFSPSNFLLTNPQALRQTIESNGENLVKGMRNLLADIENSNHSFKVKQTDTKSFMVGTNLATTPGKIIFQNDLMQLIQYSPATDKVYKTPVLLIPAWINKFYIFDMRQENSLVKWMVDQGITVFMISWVNPDEKLSDKTFADYMFKGPIAAMDAIKKATGEDKINVMSYCLGGTLTAITMAYLKAKKQERVKSVTYLTTMIDFKNPGDLGVFIDEEQISALEQKMNDKGYLEGSSMAHVFNMLRANDLIWSFVINNYLLGKEPFPFDLLYWNNDSTRMPAKMHSFYLRNMYLENNLIKQGGIKIEDVEIDLSRITTPAYILSTSEDHIAPWKSTFAATKIYKSPVKFVLSASGHVAGVINPPYKDKYSYWTWDKNIKSWEGINPQEWYDKSKKHAGSWWPNWLEWSKDYLGGKVAARKPGGGKLKVIENAPGSYVKVRSG